MDKRILIERLRDLNWTTYRLAQEVSRVRTEIFGDEVKNPRSLISSLDKALENPDASSMKTIEAMVKAMGGELLIRWPETKTVVTGHKEEKL